MIICQFTLYPRYPTVPFKRVTTFDYETNSMKLLHPGTSQGRVQCLVEGIFTVVLSDVYEPSRPNHLIDLNDSVSLEMIWVEPGTFTMGSPTSEPGRDVDENEVQVSLTSGYFLGKYELTQAQYQAVMEGNEENLSTTPSQYGGNPHRPVEQVSWNDMLVFLERLNELEADNLPHGYRVCLAHRSTGEYACRAGTSTIYSWGDEINASHANYSVSGMGESTDVGLYSPNPWGFYDMHGNVWELPRDWYEANRTESVLHNPTGPATGSYKMRKGGSFYNGSNDQRSATRGNPHRANL